MVVTDNASLHTLAIRRSVKTGEGSISTDPDGECGPLQSGNAGKEDTTSSNNGPAAPLSDKDPLQPLVGEDHRLEVLWSK